MTEISLIVTLNIHFNSTQLNKPRVKRLMIIPMWLNLLSRVPRRVHLPNEHSYSRSDSYVRKSKTQI